MNLDVVTIQDCIDMYDLKEYSTTLNDGKVIGFKAEKIPTAVRGPPSGLGTGRIFLGLL